MSLDNHIDGKEDLLAGIVECLWQQVEQSQGQAADWRAVLERSSRAFREMILERRPLPACWSPSLCCPSRRCGPWPRRWMSFAGPANALPKACSTWAWN